MSLRRFVRQLKPIQENNHRVRKALLNEGDTKAALDMEKVIVSGAGGPKFTSKLIRNSDVVGKRIAKKLKLTGLGGKMPDNTYPASAAWNEYFKPGKAKGSTLTPKTDIMVGKYKISVKTGDAVLMSGEKKEATATFYTAMDKAGNVNDAVKKLQGHIDSLLPSTDMTKYNIKGNKTELEKAGKLAEIEILRKADEAHHAFKEDLRDVFKNSPDFAREFTFEAMTGKVKFNDNDGTATHFLVTDFDGLRPTMHKVTKSSDKYVSKIMKYVNPDVTFKSGQKVKTKAGKKTKTGFYTFWSAVKIGVEMIVEEEIKNANLLTEGIIDVIKRTFKKALSWIRDFFGKIYKFISKSFKRVFDFMDIEPVVSADGIAPSTISWPN